MKFEEIFESNDNVRIVYEEYRGGNLRERLAKATLNRVDFREATEVAYRILRGVEHMHEQGIAHLNIHPETIRFKDEKDYGFDCGLFEVGHSATAETIAAGGLAMSGILGFCAPELMNPNDQEKPGLHSDIFSIGSLMFTM